MKQTDINQVIVTLERESKNWQVPIVTKIAETQDPYRVLISTILSLRTKDETTSQASERLFKLADTPEKMVQFKVKQIEKMIYPVGFYRTKAKCILDISRRLIDEYKSRVPDEIDELLKLKGVGRKTANLVITLGYGKLGICVDVHVHRISNRLGIVKTKTPEETEFALRKILPEKYWIRYNDLLVAFGQTLCRPTSPWCSKCPIMRYCPRLGVNRTR